VAPARPHRVAFLIATLVLVLIALGVAALVASSDPIPRPIPRGASEEVNAWVRLAEKHLSEGALEETEAEATKALEADPSNEPAWYARARARLRRGELRQALGDFDCLCTGSKWWTPRAEHFLGRATTYHQLGNYDAAIEDDSRVIDEDPSSVAAWLDRGSCRLAKNDAQGALNDFWRAVELDSKNVDAYRGRARANEALGEKGPARSDWKSVLERVPVSSEEALEARAAIDRLK
jgi:serine/threonine-protein kinase